MTKKNEIELARAERTKIIKYLTRLKYSILADREINDVLSTDMAKFDRAIQQGELKQLDLGEVLSVEPKNN